MTAIVFTGPESTGKTTLAHRSARHYDFPLVEEYAREYIAGLDRTYAPSDLHIIARHQEEMITNSLHSAKNVIADTDLLTVIIWYEEKFGVIPAWMKESWESTSRHYLLCAPDLPWEFDLQRENPEDRDRLFDIYLHWLEASHKSYDIVRGSGDRRYQGVLGLIDQLIRPVKPK